MKTHSLSFFEFKIYRIKIALVHGGGDAEQTEFAVFNFVGIRDFGCFAPIMRLAAKIITKCHIKLIFTTY